MKRLLNQSNTNGFTLVELLVVVLIVAILVAVAMSYYEKAVEQSRAAEALVLLKSVYEAQEIFRSANGRYAKKLDSLVIKLPWTGKVVWYKTDINNARSNKDWSLQIGEGNAGSYVSIGRLRGNYKGAGFIVYNNPKNSRLTKGKIYCGECKGSVCRDNFAGDTGDYCHKIFATPETPYYLGTLRSFIMP